MEFSGNVAVQWLLCVWLFATPWTAAHQASLSFTISQSLLKLMSIEWVMLSRHLILCRPPLLPPSIFPSIRVFSDESGGQSTGVAASASVLPMNIQGVFPLGLTGWISLQSMGLSRAFSSTTLQKHQFFCAQAFFMIQLSRLYVITGNISTHILNLHMSLILPIFLHCPCYYNIQHHF